MGWSFSQAMDMHAATSHEHITEEATIAAAATTTTTRSDPNPNQVKNTIDFMHVFEGENQCELEEKKNRNGEWASVFMWWRRERAREREALFCGICETVRDATI